MEFDSKFVYVAIIQICTKKKTKWSREISKPLKLTYWLNQICLVEKLGGVKQLLTLVKVQAYKNNLMLFYLIACMLTVQSTGMWKSQSYIHPERNSVGLNKVWPKQISHRHTIVHSFTHHYVCVIAHSLVTIYMWNRNHLLWQSEKWKS